MVRPNRKGEEAGSALLPGSDKRLSSPVEMHLVETGNPLLHSAAAAVGDVARGSLNPDAGFSDQIERRLFEAA